MNKYSLGRQFKKSTDTGGKRQEGLSTLLTNKGFITYKYINKEIGGQIIILVPPSHISQGLTRQNHAK